MSIHEISDDAILPGPWKSKVQLPSEPIEMTVTAEMAGDWLDNRFRPGKDTHKQRKTHSRIKIGQMARLIEKGKFPTTHQGLAFDINGWLQDGWHRLTALRMAAQTNPSATLVIWVFPNQDPNNFDSIDVGTMRLASQLYPGKNGKLVTSAVRYLVPGNIGRYERMMSVSDQVWMAEQWTELDQWATAAQSIARTVHVPGAQHLAVLAQAQRSEHFDLVQDWVDGVSKGWNLAPGDVRGHLRNRAWREDAMNPDDIYGLIAKAWDYYVHGKRLQNLKFGSNESTPDIPGFYGVPATVQARYDA